MKNGYQYFTDRDGHQVAIATTTTDRSGTVHHVEIIADGEVIDHYTLIGDHALVNTRQRLGWRLDSQVAVS